MINWLAMAAMTRVLVAFDGSESARRSLGRLALLSTSLAKFQALLLNVQPPPPPKEFFLDGRLSHVHELQAPLRAAGETLLGEARQVLEGAGISCEAHVEFGEPAPVIAQFAERYHCDVIAMGTRGMGLVPNLLLGSVATKVLHLAAMPVLLTR